MVAAGLVWDAILGDRLRRCLRLTGQRESDSVISGLRCRRGAGVGALLVYPGVARILIVLAVVYMTFLAYRIAMAPPLGERASQGRTPGFLAGFLLGITNPKGYAVFATLFSGLWSCPITS